jgi:hypothetical protein
MLMLQAFCLYERGTTALTTNEQSAVPTREQSRTPGPVQNRDDAPIGLGCSSLAHDFGKWLSEQPRPGIFASAVDDLDEGPSCTLIKRRDKQRFVLVEHIEARSRRDEETRNTASTCALRGEHVRAPGRSAFIHVRLGFRVQNEDGSKTLKRSKYRAPRSDDHPRAASRGDPILRIGRDLVSTASKQCDEPLHVGVFWQQDQ